MERRKLTWRGINGSKGGIEMILLLLLIYILVVCILFILAGFFEEELSELVGYGDKEIVIIEIFTWPITLAILLLGAIITLPFYIFNKIGTKLRKKYDEKFSKNN